LSGQKKAKRKQPVNWVGAEPQEGFLWLEGMRLKRKKLGLISKKKPREKGRELLENKKSRWGGGACTNVNRSMPDSQKKKCKKRWKNLSCPGGPKPKVLAQRKKSNKDGVVLDHFRKRIECETHPKSVKRTYKKRKKKKERRANNR